MDGISMPLVLLTTLLSLLAIVYSAYSREEGIEQPGKEFFFFLLLMETGLLGFFLAFDLLLFYIFWEVAIVPLYFIIGIWGHGEKRKAALKFFLYTRAASLALLLGILALYLHTNPRSFGMEAIQNAGVSLGTTRTAFFVLTALALGFGIKLPLVPLHSWLPDAHVQAPTPGSVMLAGVLLKMGGYGLIRLLLPSLGQALAAVGPVFAVIALVAVIYGAAVAMAQRDFKRLVAFTSINHMGFVLLAVTIAALGIPSADRVVAINGAVVQMVSHGLLTGGMFFLVGMLQVRAGSREFSDFGGGWGPMPAYAVVLTTFALGSFGLPTMSGFVAEFQVFTASLSAYVWAAVLLALGVVISTALYLWALQRILFGQPSQAMVRARDLRPADGFVMGALAASVFAIGLFPGPLLAAIERSAQSLVR
jgi:NADH-quinone oxidoreductase subunit M